MPEPFRTTLSPRYYECDLDGQLTVANTVRYALQAAIEAGAPADLKTPGLEAAGWLEHVGDIGIQISKPVLFGDRLEVQVRLTRVGPPVWRREFTFQRGGDEVAQAFVDTFDADESQPEMEDDVAEQSDENPAWDGPALEPPEPPRRAFRAVWLVAGPHLDISGQLDPGWLTQTLADMDSRAAEVVGWSAARDQESGIAWQIVEHRLEMFETIQAGDQLNITTYIGELGDDEMVRHASVERRDERVKVQVARGRTRWACVSTSSAERCRIPDDWINDLSDQMADL